MQTKGELMRQWNTESARLRHIKELKQTDSSKNDSGKAASVTSLFLMTC